MTRPHFLPAASLWIIAPGPELLLTQNPEPHGVGLLVPLQVAADAGVVPRLVPPHSLHHNIIIIINIIINIEHYLDIDTVMTIEYTMF